MTGARPRGSGAGLTPLLLIAPLFFVVPACSAPDLTLQVAVSEDGAAAAWVRSGRSVLVIFLDDRPDPALVAPFLSDPEVGQAVAVAYLAPTDPLDPGVIDAPAFVPPRGTAGASGAPGAGGLEVIAADPVLLPSLAPGVSATWTSSDRHGHGSVRIRARRVDWQISSGSGVIAPPEGAPAAGLPAAEAGFDLVVGPWLTDASLWAITETVSESSAGRAAVFPIYPGERFVYAATSTGTSRIDGPVPVAVLGIDPRHGSNETAALPADPTATPSSAAPSSTTPSISDQEPVP